MRSIAQRIILAWHCLGCGQSPMTYQPPVYPMYPNPWVYPTYWPGTNQPSRITYGTTTNVPPANSRSWNEGGSL